MTDVSPSAIESADESSLKSPDSSLKQQGSDRESVATKMEEVEGQEANGNQRRKEHDPLKGVTDLYT